MVFRVGPETLLAAMRAVGWGFVLTCSAHVCGLLLDSVVLRACAGKRGRKVPYLHFARTSIAGHGVNEATPFGKVGEIVKYTLLDEKLPAADSALVLFGAVGLAPHVGLMVEIGRKARRLVFIVVGVTVLGWGTFRRLTSGERLRPAEDEA